MSSTTVKKKVALSGVTADSTKPLVIPVKLYGNEYEVKIEVPFPCTLKVELAFEEEQEPR